MNAGIVKELGEYIWDSHQCYVSDSKKWDWLYRDFLLSMFARKKSMARKAYVEFVSKKEPDEIEKFYSKKNLPSILGGEIFKERIKEKFKHFFLNKEVPESRIFALSPENVIVEVCRHFNIDEQTLMVSKRGEENLARDMAIYLVRHYIMETLLNVGKYFDINNYSTVSSVVERVKKRKIKDPSLRDHLEKIEKKLDKSQKQI